MLKFKLATYLAFSIVTGLVWISFFTGPDRFGLGKFFAFFILVFGISTLIVSCLGTIIWPEKHALEFFLKFILSMAVSAGIIIATFTTMSVMHERKSNRYASDTRVARKFNREHYQEVRDFRKELIEITEWDHKFVKNPEGKIISIKFLFRLKTNLNPDKLKIRLSAFLRFDSNRNKPQSEPSWDFMDYAFPEKIGENTFAQLDQDGLWTVSFSDIKVTDNTLVHLSRKFGEIYEFNPILELTYMGETESFKFDSPEQTKKKSELLKDFHIKQNHKYMLWELATRHFGILVPSEYSEGYEKYRLGRWREYRGHRIYPILRNDLIKPIQIKIEDFIKSP